MYPGFLPAGGRTSDVLQPVLQVLLPVDDEDDVVGLIVVEPGELRLLALVPLVVGLQFLGGRVGGENVDLDLRPEVALHVVGHQPPLVLREGAQLELDVLPPLVDHLLVELLYPTCGLAYLNWFFTF